MGCRGGDYPVAVPCVRLADGAAALHTDRGHSLSSLDSATGGHSLSSPPAGALLKFIVDAYNIQFCGEIMFIYADVGLLFANTGEYFDFDVFIN